MNIVCERCGNGLHPSNLFCPRCGEEAPRGTRIGDAEPENITDPQYCPLCGHPSPSGSVFCSACGHGHFKKPEDTSSVFCPGCGSRNSSGARVCYSCSLSLEEWFLKKGEAARRLGQKLPFVLKEKMNGFSYNFVSGDRLSLGRASDNDICIPCSFVSAHHLEIDFGENKLRDLSSTNGTFINRRPEEITAVPLDTVNEFNAAGSFTFTVIRNDAFTAFRLSAILDEEECRRNGDGSAYDLLRRIYFISIKGNGRILAGKTDGRLAAVPKSEEIYWELEHIDGYIYLSDPVQGIYRQLVGKGGAGLAANWQVESTA